VTANIKLAQLRCLQSFDLRRTALVPLLMFASTAWAQFNPWVNEISITGDAQFDIYDRQAQALVQNPVYQHDDPSVDPQRQPAGVVGATSVILTVDLDGQVAVGDPILVRVRPGARIGKTDIPVSPDMLTVKVAQWSDPDALSFSLTAPQGVGKHEIDIVWSIETSSDGGETWFTEVPDESLHTLYTTYARPIISSTYLGMRPERGNPWIDVIDRASTWAAGLDNDDEIMQAITIALWTNSEHIYDGGNHSTPTDYNSMNVDRFLNPSIDGRADCRDMSNFLALLGRSLGLNVTTFRIRGGAFSASYFYTQYLGPHGGHQPAFILRPGPTGPVNLFTTPPVHQWTQTAWNYHQVALYNGRIYDACAQIELSPFVPRNPSDIINQRNLTETDANRLGYEYIPDGDYLPNKPGFLLSSTYSDYQPQLVLNETYFLSYSHIEQQGAPPIVR
jgi:hypothetical protein